MPAAKNTYTPEMRDSEHGRRLYRYWIDIHNDTDSVTFAEYPGFFEWAMANGYTVGAKLLRHDESKTFTPENCFWVTPSELKAMRAEKDPDKQWMRLWDRTVNRLRRHFDMEPIHSSEV